MIVGFTDVLGVLEQRKLCLPAFDIAGGQSDFVLGILRACEQARCPAMFLVWAPGATYIGLEACADLVRSLAARATVPVVLHLDHTDKEEVVQQCIALGFKSVMFDCSKLPLDENIRRTRAMAEFAHAHGACIEGELGVIGSEQAAQADATKAMTDPAEAVRFVKETGIDFFAPAVGNAHGWYAHPPKLNFDLIARLRAETGVPLVMHGGTGIPMGDINRSAELGVRKLNVATVLHKTFTDGMAAQVAGADGKWAWQKVLAGGRSAIGGVVSEYLRELKIENLV
jgi:ketose-bisphosphate aldolase